MTSFLSRLVSLILGTKEPSVSKTKPAVGRPIASGKKASGRDPMGDLPTPPSREARSSSRRPRTSSGAAGALPRRGSIQVRNETAELPHPSRSDSAAPPPTTVEPHEPRAVPVEAQPAPVAPTENVLRIGLDFGTSTTQVAVRVGQAEPFLIPLEPGLDNLPSYVALREEDGGLAFGSEAKNLAVSVHSIKPMLIDDPTLRDLGGLRASDAAQALLEEVVARTLKFLRAQRLVGESVDRLELATSLGTTPRFNLVTRTRLRDIAQAAGIQVRLADLIEEPVAAAFELIYGGTASDGRLMVVDVGGGTLDVAILRSDLGTGTFELFATRGATAAGDRFTQVIEDFLRKRIQAITERTDELDRRSTTLLWSRAEDAKLRLATSKETVVALGGIADLQSGEVELTRDWYEYACRPLRRELVHEIQEAYRQARLILDRGGDGDPSPGTMLIKMARNKAVTYLSDAKFDLAADAREHLDAVIPVGGGSLSPVVRAALTEYFGDLVRDPFVDPIGAVALGLARGDRLKGINLRYPDWGISALFDRSEDEVPLYEPYASTLSVHGGQTSVYSYDHQLPAGSEGVRILFRPVGGGEAQPWPVLTIPKDSTHLRLGLDLFGRVNLLAIGPESNHQANLLEGRDDLRAPWMPAEGVQVGPWVPRPKDKNWFDHVPQWSYGDNP